jgi:acetolactate synthase-1/2/3 large subunit
MTRMTGGKAIIKSLELYGVDTLFGLPGVEIDQLFVALYDEREAIRVIGNRHEQGCAYMAFGYAQSTGRVGAFAVVPGPGLLNASAALATAYSCNTPVLCITGQVPSQQIGRGSGAHHEISDQLGILRNLTKEAIRIEHPAGVPDAVEKAFRALSSGRRRPVGLEMAPDVMAMEADVALRKPGTTPGPMEPDPELIEEAAVLLGGARNPMIVVGSGVFSAEEELLQVAEILQAPVTMSQNARGAISSRHYLGLPESAGHRIWAEADVVLAVGTRLHEQYRDWGIDDELKLIRIDIDPSEIERNGKPATGILADAKVALAALAEGLGRHNLRRPSRKDELEALKARFEQEFEKLSPQIHYIKAIRAELPDDGFVVGESTQLAYAVRVAMPFYRPRTYVTHGYQGTLGYGFPTALGVKVAHPDKQVISITGDGGFLFGASELAIAVQHRIATVTLIFNNNAYGNVKRSQIQKYGGRVIATDLHNPDFVKLAECYGALGLRAETPEALRAAIRRGFNHDGPTLIEIPVGDLPSPWHLIHMPRVRKGGPAEAKKT